MTHTLFRGIGFLLLGGVVAAEAGNAGPTAEVVPGSLVGEQIFRIPTLASGLRRFRDLLEQGDRPAAAALLDRLSAEFPHAGVLHAARAAFAEGAAAAESRPGALDVLAALSAPVQANCPTTTQAAEEPAILGEIEPALVGGNEAPITAENTGWSPTVQRLVSGFVFPPVLSRKPLSPNAGNPAQGALPAAEWRQLRSLVARGRAAGLAGAVYDNRDRGHSSLSPAAWPQLAFTGYLPAARAAGLDFGLNTELLFDAVTFGNSSTAMTRGFWRSQPRLALSLPEGAERLFQLYANDHLYAFPEHQDHDPVEGGGKGDLFPANTPYYLVSQGSSGSDRPFLVAVAAILAAMKPEVRDFLDRHGLVAPTVQMVFRRGLEGVDGAEAYMSPRAHPSAFRAEDIDLARMIDTAQALEADAVPPMVCIRVQSQTHPIPRVGYFADGLSEILFDTPSAVARVWRGSDPERRFTVSASETKDPNGRALRFHWRLLRGDPAKVRISPLDEAGAQVEISIGWNERREVPGQPGLTSDRVDVSVFADNGVTLSAPAFASMLFPADQLREHETGPEGTRRIAVIDYADPERRKRYADPLLFPRRDWRDTYAYDAEGRLIGWTRKGEGKPEESFTRHGLRVLERDALGRPEQAEEVAYPVGPGGTESFEVTPTPTGRIFGYIYAGEDDSLGVPFPEPVASPE